ncbi:glycoside hydrolase family 3 N-terminal domain-containing protein [Mucilaginibacter sp. KACC 22063]|uniref:glycoside hydrolase family 3 N-terminal domain-containing protein n=1 Tax=Mucilaginibacter sp. KACC 22063 TaxID=3025666 RepID=UPI0023663429|nr:glycoside hydrolase family 3 N-terminal domain-containing protein [Mucilaginibacter sp. KACC 22063]WDF54674.1 glycoside hydrolase family 3 N-terminal domain-containing protein [Mucilaginibacter sp. KACC 22063]
MKFTAAAMLVAGTQFCMAQDKPTYLNANLPAEVRADDLIKKLTLTEKALLLGYRSKAIDRLNIPAYNWWNEGLHGVARAGEATIFPQAIGLAATFNLKLVTEIGDVISTEARAKNNLAIRRGDRGMYVGLTYWSPNINIFRDPRWGRGQETYGEDPYLTSQIGMAYVNGMQGNIPGKLKISATAKHFVAHSGPENTRDYFNSIVSDRDLHDTYLYAFNKLVKGGVSSVMTAYNSVNGVPNSVNKDLLNIVKKDWGFKGYIVTDCGALDDVFATHKYVKTPAEAAAGAIKAGINLDCSAVLQSDVVKAVEQKLITEKDVDAALKPLLLTQLKLGFFDNPDTSPYKNYLADSIHNQPHVDLAKQAALQSMVLLKNDNNVLPLKNNSYNSIMVVGPNAASLDAIVGSYHGVNSRMVNFVEGFSANVDKGTRVEYDLGAGQCDTTHFGGIWGAGNADVTVAVIGLTPVDEGEAGDAFLSVAGGDKKTLALPASHVAFMKALRKGVKKPIIAVVTAGSDVDIASIAPYADAIILAWYPGEQGGNALADIVLGKVSPSGRLPLTFYNSVNDLPAFDNYGMKGRTYRYFKGQVQYPFGYGLSYTTFDYEPAQLTKTKYKETDSLTVTCKLTNKGSMKGDDVIQAYVEYPAIDGLPVKELKAFKRETLAAGESSDITLTIPVSELKKWDPAQKKAKLYPGKYTIKVGENSRDNKSVGEFTIGK